METELLELRRKGACHQDGPEQQRLKQAYEERFQRIEKRISVRNIHHLRHSLTFTPAELEQQSEWRQKAIGLITWWAFDAAIGFVIIANALTIGIETSHVVRGDDVPLYVQILEMCFLLVYMHELGLRIFAIGLRVFRSHWVKFDGFLVLCGFVDAVIKTSLAGKTSVLDKIMLVRLLRLVRLVRAVRLVAQFRTLWLLTHGLMLSVMPMFWVFLIMIALIYFFAVMGMDLIRTDENFSDLGMSMLTLTQFMFLDSIGHVYIPLTKERPLLALFFFGFILLGSISLMNLVTATMVESAMRQAKEDQEAEKSFQMTRRKQMEPILMDLFYTMDTDDSKELELDELLSAPSNVKDQLLRICNMDDLREVFEMLDYDHSGAVDIQEFCDGIMRRQADKPAELLRLVKQCSDILQLCKIIYAAVLEGNDHVVAMTSFRPFSEDVSSFSVLPVASEFPDIVSEDL
jgi:hypothetical protein